MDFYDSQLFYDNLWYFTLPENIQEVTFDELRQEALKDRYTLFYSERYAKSEHWLI